MPAKRATRTGSNAPGEPVDEDDRLPVQRPADDITTTAPRLPRIYVPRARLWRRLGEVTGNGITLVVAPVGAGKTLGVSGWLRTTDQERTPWIQADASWSPSRLAELLDAGTATGGPAPLVVIDDAHDLPSSTMRLLDQRLDEAPDTLRLILLSRWDLPLTRLAPELLGHYTTVRGDVLRMDDEECTPLITEHARTDHPEVVRSIIQRSNGWVAAVVLASRAIAATPDAVTSARRYADGDASIADRLASEVFAALQPRERHVLLCVANEEVVTVEEAAHLSHDSRAGQVLSDLETTGFLVTRLAPDRALTHALERYRIHPLLIEAVRRRLMAGGVDVARAQSTILRAVRLDLTRGEIDKAFGRLVGANLAEEATQVLVEHGVSLLLRGGGSLIAAFARLHPDTVDATPGSWFVLGLERWLDNDAGGASHWLDRLTEDAGEGRHRELSAELACARLIRARMGAEPAAAATGHARKVVLTHMRASTPEPLLPLLVNELGMVQGWLGDLGEAEVNLASAVSLSRTRGLHRLTMAALTHLALVLYMQGRESACIEIADEALEQIPVDVDDPGLDHLRARGELARDLAMLCDVPWPDHAAADGGSTETAPLHIGDPTGRFWALLREARLALMAGSVSGAEQILEVPPTWFAFPEHLRVILLIERGFLASLSGDQRALRHLASELESLGARGEATLLTGLRHELESDRKAAATAYALAREDVTYSQPASRALALTCEAQLLDVLGRSEEAMDLLREAATLTEVRRNAVPFLGWSRQGTPIETLLGRLESESPTAWIHEIAAAGKGRPDISAVFAPMTATPRERTRAGDTTVRPSLSAREREVLNELARGATYADIAAELFVSENTIKTHVSSLYGKLAVTRRSEALAVARSQHLL